MSLYVASGVCKTQLYNLDLVTLLGFEPKAILVMEESQPGALFKGDNSLFWTQDMPNYYSYMIRQNLSIDNTVISYSSAGFTVDHAINNYWNSLTADNQANDGWVWWMALGGSDVETGTYSGDGIDNKQISTAAEPKMVIVNGVGRGYGVVRMASMTSGDSQQVAHGVIVGGIKSFTGGGSPYFTLGTHADVNNDGTTYYWMSLSGSNVETGSYTGNVTQRDIAVSGFDPDAVFVKLDRSWSGMCCRGPFNGEAADINMLGIKEFTEDNFSVAWGGSGDVENSLINGLGTNEFSVGEHNVVNENGETCYWTALNLDNEGDEIRVTQMFAYVVQSKTEGYVAPVDHPPLFKKRTYTTLRM